MPDQVVNRAGFSTYLRFAMLRTAHLAGTLLGEVMYLSRSARYRHSQTNIKLCYPSLSSEEVKYLTRRSLRETGKLLCELILFWFFPTNSGLGFITNIHGEKHIRDAHTQNRGVILVCPHLGNWELCNAYAGRFNPSALYKPLKSRWLDQKVRRSREHDGSRLVPTSAQGIKALRQTLQHGGTIFILPDQSPKLSGRTLAPFFGIPTWTGTLTCKLAQKSNAVVIFGFAKRLHRGQGFEIILTPAADGIYDQNPEDAVAAMNLGIEQCIANCPEQYTWQYKRFKGSIEPNPYR